MKNKYKLFKHGFEVKKINFSKLNIFKKLNNRIAKDALNKFEKNTRLENIHQKYIANFNEYRLDIIKKINKIKDIKKTLFEILRDDLEILFGKDIVIQKFINLGIQRPNDPERTPMHSDSPSHSLFEVVIWIPLVDSRKTMGMYFFPTEISKKAKKLVVEGNNKEIEEFAKKFGKNLDIKFGEFVVFLTDCFHYIPINKEPYTRWSINLRFKNTFTPYSKKGFLDYYEPISYSKITERALDEKK